MDPGRRGGCARHPGDRRLPGLGPAHTRSGRRGVEPSHPRLRLGGDRAGPRRPRDRAPRRAALGVRRPARRRPAGDGRALHAAALAAPGAQAWPRDAPRPRRGHRAVGARPRGAHPARAAHGLGRHRGLHADRSRRGGTGPRGRRPGHRGPRRPLHERGQRALRRRRRRADAGLEPQAPAPAGVGPRGHRFRARRRPGPHGGRRAAPARRARRRPAAAAPHRAAPLGRAAGVQADVRPRHHRGDPPAADAGVRGHRVRREARRRARCSTGRPASGSAARPSR